MILHSCRILSVSIIICCAVFWHLLSLICYSNWTFWIIFHWLIWTLNTNLVSHTVFTRGQTHTLSLKLNFSMKLNVFSCYGRLSAVLWVKSTQVTPSVALWACLLSAFSQVTSKKSWHNTRRKTRHIIICKTINFSILLATQSPQTTRVAIN